MRLAPLLMLLALAGAGCAGETDDERPRPEPEAPPAQAPAVPDGGVREGHGADDDAPAPRERGSIVVPESDLTPPRPVVRLAGRRATVNRGAPPVRVPRDEPIRVVVTGRDRDGGMGRARVAIIVRLTCGGGAATERFVRYVPRPQIARVRIAPGTRTRTKLIRTVVQSLGAAECGGAALERFSGQAWADVTNASGLDATSRHIHFASR